MLELTIQMAVGSLIAEHQRIGQIITAELPFKNLRALFVSLYLERHGDNTPLSFLHSSQFTVSHRQPANTGLQPTLPSCVSWASF
jgi:hypothetical protein